VGDSYDALGLVAALKPNESGGTEHNQYERLEAETIPSTSTRGDPKGVLEVSTGAKKPTRYGRIRSVQTMDVYADEKSATRWSQLGPRTATRTKRPNSVVEGMGTI